MTTLQATPQQISLAISCIRIVLRIQDLGGISMGRSVESRALEAACAILKDDSLPTSDYADEDSTILAAEDAAREIRRWRHSQFEKANGYKYRDQQ